MLIMFCALVVGLAAFVAKGRLWLWIAIAIAFALLEALYITKTGRDPSYHVEEQLLGIGFFLAAINGLAVFIAVKNRLPAQSQQAQDDAGNVNSVVVDQKRPLIRPRV